MKVTPSHIDQGLDYYNEYVSRRINVEKALNELNINIISRGTNKDNQYTYTLYINDQSFDYFEGRGHKALSEKNAGEKVISAIHCLILDESFSGYSLDEFASEMSITKPSEALRTYLDIQDNAKKIHQALGKHFELLQNNLEL